MNEKRIKSLVKILKTTISELEDEMQSDPFTCPGTNYTDMAINELSNFNVDYADVLTYYGEHDGIG